MRAANNEIPQLDENDKSRFHSRYKINEDSGCHEWTAGLFERGYGAFRVSKQSLRAHRVAFLLSTGIQPLDLLVCHTCDNPKCVNPAHLFLGTSKNNSDDMFAKGRANKSTGDKHGTKTKPERISKGEDRPLSKLKQFQIPEIRALAKSKKISQQEIALIYGVSRRLIGMVLKNKIWKHVKSTPTSI